MKSGRIFVALLLLTGVVGALVTGADIYSRFLYLGVLLVVRQLGLDALDRAGIAFIAQCPHPARQCG